MLAPVLAVSAVIPSLLLVLYFHRRDLYPEPGKVIWATFGLGIATIPGVLIVALPVDALLKGIADAHVAGLCSAFLTAAIPEEFFKLLVVRFWAARHAAFDEPMDGVVYGAVASLGFATLENVMYVASGGVGVAVLRAFTAVPAHAFMGAIMGYYVGRAKFHPEERGRAMILAYLVPMILHGLYDYPVLTLRELSERGLPNDAALPVLPLTLLALLTLWIWAIRGLRRARADQDRGHAARLAGGPALAPAPAAAPFAPVSVAAPVRPYAAPAHGPGWVGGTILLALGLLAASVGGLVTLGVVLALAMGKVPPWEQNQTILGVVFIGVLPLVAGFVMFALGLRSLNRSSVAVVAVARPG